MRGDTHRRQESREESRVAMNMEQRPALLAEIHRLEGLVSYAESHCDQEEMERLKERLNSLIAQIYRYRKYTPEEANLIADTNLMARPFFKDFRDEELYGEGGNVFLQSNSIVRWYALSHGIPVESFAVGANPVPKWGATVQGNILKSSTYKDGVSCNVNMARNCVPGTDEDKANESEKELPWIHSYFIKNSLFDTTILYEAIVDQIGSTKPKEAKENE